MWIIVACCVEVEIICSLDFLKFSLARTMFCPLSDTYLWYILCTFINRFTCFNIIKWLKASYLCTHFYLWTKTFEKKFCTTTQKHIFIFWHHCICQKEVKHKHILCSHLYQQQVQNIWISITQLNFIALFVIAEDEMCHLTVFFASW